MVPNQFKPYTPGTKCGKCPNTCDNGLCSTSCVAAQKLYQDIFYHDTMIYFWLNRIRRILDFSSLELIFKFVVFSANPCPYTNDYSNCEVASGGVGPLFPTGCANAPSYLASYKVRRQPLLGSPVDELSIVCTRALTFSCFDSNFYFQDSCKATCSCFGKLLY